MNRQVLDFVKNAGLTGRIVDVGSFDVNGSVREVVKIDCGIDMRPGKGVDRVMLAEEMDQHFSDLDGVTCCNTLEHVEKWREALTSMWKSLKVGGKLVFAVPTIGKGFHGYPSDYWRWDMAQIKQIFSNQKIKAESENLGNVLGVVVKKVNDDLDLTPEPVPMGKKR